MVRSLLIATATLAVLITTVVGVVGAGLHSIAAAKREANASWRPIDPPPPASQPAATVTTVDDEPFVPQFDSIELWAKDAVPHGSVLLIDPRDPQSRFDGTDDQQGFGRRRGRFGRQPSPYLRDFRTLDDYAVWEFEVIKAGVYEIDVTCACAQWNGEGRCHLRLGDTEFPFAVEASRGGPSNFRVMAVGKMTVAPGKNTVAVGSSSTSSNDHTFLNLRNVLLVPVR